MSEQLQLRKGTSTNISAFTGALAEVVVDTTNNRVVVQDGATAGGFAAAKLSEVLTNGRTTVSDAAYGAGTTDRLIAYTALTAARVVTLPTAASFPKGTPLVLVDETGNCSATLTLTLTAAGGDAINGGGTAVLNVAYGYFVVESNGSHAWTIIAQSPAATPVLDTIAAGAKGSQVQIGILETLVSPLSGSSTNAPTQIPANSIVFAVGARVTTTITGATTFEVGVSGTLAQFGSGIALTSGTTNYGVVAPAFFASATTIILTAAGSNFTAGAVRLSIVYMLCGPPTS